MERAYMPPAEPPPLERDVWGASHPKTAVAGPLPEPQESTHLRHSYRRQHRHDWEIGAKSDRRRRQRCALMSSTSQRLGEANWRV
jgi:hypothetical protein